MNDKEYMLSKLLDAYEGSKCFREGQPPQRRIAFKLYGNKKDNFYDIEQSERRISVNRAVMELSRQELIFYEWVKREENHIISSIWLNFDRLQDVYYYVKRRPKADMIDELCLKILELSDDISTEWLKCFLLDTYEAIYRDKDVGNKLPVSNDDKEDLFKVIRFIDKSEGEGCSERVFSMKCFGDSKRFERTVKVRILGIIKKYADTSDDNTDEELLRIIGITKYPEQFEFSGNAQFVYQNKEIDFSILKCGACISGLDFKRGNFVLNNDISKIISIENKANYVDYICNRKKDDEFVIYHGGQYSPSKGKFLKAIANMMTKGCQWLHWGDIDYGGFTMLARLRREIYENIMPYRMGIEELKRYEQFTISVNNDYIKKLSDIMNYIELEDLKECIQYMIKNKKKLEQEAMLTDIGEE